MTITRFRACPWCVAATTAATLTFAVPVFASTIAPRQEREQAAVQGHERFDDHDRQNVKTWFDEHRQAPPAGLRDRDRLEEPSHVVVGKVLDPELRKHAYTVPADLRRKLPDPRTGDRFYLIDGQLCLVDGTYTVRDTIAINRR